MTPLDKWIERWKTGDESAAASIYNAHRERVFRLAFALLGNLEDAEEAAQDALTYALIHIHNFDPRRSKFTTWLHTITVSRSRDLLRKKRIPTLSLSDWIQRFKGTHVIRSNHDRSHPEQITIRLEDQETVWTSIQKLSPILREAIVLRHWGGHTYREIAEITGCPIRTAQSRVRLAYAQLRKILEHSNFGKIAQEIS